MSDETRATLIRQNSMENQQFFDMLVNSVADRAVEKMEATAARSRQRIAVVGTVATALTLTLLTSGATLFTTSLRETARVDAEQAAADFLSNQIDDITESVVALAEASLTDAVEESSEAAQAAWNDTSAMLQARALVDSFIEDEIFSEGDALELLGLLSGFANENKYLQLDGFAPLLEDAIDAFAAAERNDLIVRLEPMFGDLMLEKRGIVFTMVLALGRELVWVGFTPETIGEGTLLQEWSSTHSRYNTYANAARSLRLPELPYLFDILIACMDGASQVAVEEYVNRAAQLTEQERDFVLNVSATYVRNKSLVPRRAQQRNINCVSQNAELDDTGLLAAVLE